jgi:hypothetical protein
MEAEQIVSTLRARPFVAAFAVATVYMGLGDIDTAIDWLQRAIEQKYMWLIWLKVDPMYDALRASPRFPALLDTIGFPS